MYPHQIAWADGDKPRWNTATCKKCDRTWSVHDVDALDWRPPIDCEIR